MSGPSRQKDHSGWKTRHQVRRRSGTLIEKQCRRLFEGEVPSPLWKTPRQRGTPKQRTDSGAKQGEIAGEAGGDVRPCEAEAEKRRGPARFLGEMRRVIQSDLIHKQNEGANAPGQPCRPLPDGCEELQDRRARLEGVWRAAIRAGR